MAITRGSTGTGQTPGASEALAFSRELDGVDATTIMVRNRSSATGDATVRIARLHGATGGVPIIAGDREYFRVDDGGIVEMYISGANASVDWGPVASTKS